VLALAGGVALVALGQDRPRLRVGIDGFILGVIPTLLLVRVLPHLWAQLGMRALAFGTAGYGTFWLLERVAERQRLRARIVVTVLALHSLLDGGSLAVAPLQGEGVSLVLMGALVVHRLPEGVMVGALLMPRHGLRVAAFAAAVLAAATLTGAAAGTAIMRRVDGAPLDLFVAAGMGALLRAVLHGHPSLRLRTTPAFLSALLGAVVALAVPEVP
jgi:zinc transporter ZupT